MEENSLQSPLDEEKPRGSRWHWFRLYYDVEDFKNILEHHIGVINQAHFILHDKDLNEDGEEIKPHIHCLLYLYDTKPSRIIEDWFSDNCGIRFFNCREPPVAMRYLLHLGFKDKYQYDYNECLHIGSVVKFDNALAEYSKKFDKAVCCLNDLLNGATWYECAVNYGKDFIYHIQHYKKLLELIGTDFVNSNIDLELEEETADCPF